MVRPVRPATWTETGRGGKEYGIPITLFHSEVKNETLDGVVQQHARQTQQLVSRYVCMYVYGVESGKRENGKLGPGSHVGFHVRTGLMYMRCGCAVWLCCTALTAAETTLHDAAAAAVSYKNPRSRFGKANNMSRRAHRMHDRHAPGTADEEKQRRKRKAWTCELTLALRACIPSRYFPFLLSRLWLSPRTYSKGKAWHGMA